MATDELTTERPTASTDWNEAFHNYERAKEACDQAAAAHTAAEEAAIAEARAANPIDWTAEYGLHYGMASREKVLEALRYYPANAAAKAAAAGKPLADAEVSALYADIPRIADEYLVAREVSLNAHAKHRTDELEKAMEAAADTYWASFKAVMKAPAPDAEALIAKLDILTSEMTVADADDAERVAAIRDDARRLFGRA